MRAAAGGVTPCAAASAASPPSRGMVRSRGGVRCSTGRGGATAVQPRLSQSTKQQRAAGVVAFAAHRTSFYATSPYSSTAVAPVSTAAQQQQQQCSQHSSGMRRSLQKSKLGGFCRHHLAAEAGNRAYEKCSTVSTDALHQQETHSTVDHGSCYTFSGPIGTSWHQLSSAQSY